MVTGDDPASQEDCFIMLSIATFVLVALHCMKHLNDHEAEGACIFSSVVLYVSHYTERFEEKITPWCSPPY